MNPHQQSVASFTRRLLHLTILGAASIFLISALSAIGQTQSDEPSDERKFKVKEFKDMPLEVEVKNLQSKTWHKDLEIEVTNVSNKPIYFILAYLIFPDDKVPNGDVGIALHYGKRENILITHLADANDPHLAPGETYIFTIPEPERTGFQARHKKYPDLDKNLLFRFGLISFGDGTGFEVGEPRDFRERKVSFKRCYGDVDLKESHERQLISSPRRKTPWMTGSRCVRNIFDFASPQAYSLE
jgi:hypothetical protein